MQPALAGTFNVSSKLKQCGRKRIGFHFSHWLCNETWPDIKNQHMLCNPATDMSFFIPLQKPMAAVALRELTQSPGQTDNRLACEILAVINIFVHCSAHYFHPLHEFPEDFRTDVGLKFLRWLSWETRQFVWRDPDRLGSFVFLQRNWCVLKLRNPLFSHSQILVWFDSKIWIRALSLRPVKLWWKPLSIVVVLLKIK